MTERIDIEKVAQAIYEVVQDNCYCSPIGIVDGIMSGTDWINCAKAAIRAAGMTIEEPR